MIRLALARVVHRLKKSLLSFLLNREFFFKFFIVDNHNLDQWVPGNQVDGEIRQFWDKCPCCGGTVKENVTSVPFYLTSVIHFGYPVRAFFKEFNRKERWLTFPINACTECDFIYVKQTDKTLLKKAENLDTHIKIIDGSYTKIVHHIINRTVYNEIIATTECSENVDYYRYRLHLSLLSECLHNSDQGSVLDVGANAGTFCSLVTLHNPKIAVEACEPDNRLYCLLKTRYPAITAYNTPVEALPNSNSYDVVYCNDVIEHIWNLELFCSALTKIVRKDGYLIVGTPDGDCFNSRLRGIRWSGYIVPHHVQVFNKASLESLWSHFGFQLVKCKRTSEEVCVVLRKH